MSNTNGHPAPTRGVPVLLDRERHLRYPLRTVREMRERFGSEALATGLGEEHIAAMLWFGLRHEDATLTEADVELLVDMQNVRACMAACVEAMGGGSGKEGAADTPPPPAPTPPAEATPTT